jgi:hypothetical protein
MSQPLSTLTHWANDKREDALTLLLPDGRLSTLYFIGIKPRLGAAELSEARSRSENNQGPSAACGNTSTERWRIDTYHEEHLYPRTALPFQVYFVLCGQMFAVWHDVLL